MTRKVSIYQSVDNQGVGGGSKYKFLNIRQVLISHIACDIRSNQSYATKTKE